MCVYSYNAARCKSLIDPIEHTKISFLISLPCTASAIQASEQREDNGTRLSECDLAAKSVKLEFRGSGRSELYEGKIFIQGTSAQNYSAVQGRSRQDMEYRRADRGSTQPDTGAISRHAERLGEECLLRP